MPQDLKWVHYILPGGMNTSEPSTRLGDGECVLLQNVEFSDKRVWSIRRGNEAVGNAISGTPNVIDLANFLTSGGQDYLVAVASDGKMYSLTSFAGTFTEVGALSSAFLSFETFNDLLVIGRDEGVMKKFDGATLADLGGTPSFYVKDLKSFQNYLFAQVRNSSVVYFSGQQGLYPGDPEKWDEINDFFVINKDDGDRNNGMAVLGGQLLLFKRHNTYVLQGYDPTTFEVQSFLKGIGCVNPRSIQEVGNSVIWHAENKILRLRGDGTIDEISYPIRTTVDALNETYSGHSAYYPQKNQYVYAVDTGTDNQADMLLVFDLLEEKWTKWTGAWASIATTTIGSTVFSKTLVGGAYSTGRVHRLDYGTDDNTASIAFEIDSQDLDCRMPFTTKDFRAVYVWVQVGNVATVPTLDYLIDGTSEETAKTLTAAIANKMYPIRVDLRHHGRCIQFKVKYTGTVGDVHVGGFSVGFMPRDEYR